MLTKEILHQETAPEYCFCLCAEAVCVSLFCICELLSSIHPYYFFIILILFTMHPGAKWIIFFTPDLYRVNNTVQYSEDFQNIMENAH